MRRPARALFIKEVSKRSRRHGGDRVGQAAVADARVRPESIGRDIVHFEQCRRIGAKILSLINRFQIPVKIEIGTRAFRPTDMATDMAMASPMRSIILPSRLICLTDLRSFECNTPVGCALFPGWCGIFVSAGRH